jgi:hypothetical protein
MKNTWYLALMFFIALIILIVTTQCSGNDKARTPVREPATTQNTTAHVVLVKSYPQNTGCPSGGSLLLAGPDLNDDGVLQFSEIAVSADVCNTVDNTRPTPPTFTPVTLITPCGPNSTVHKQPLLGLQGGRIFSEFSHGSNGLPVRGTLLPDGKYYNADSFQCDFTVVTDNNENRSISWSGYTHNESGPFQSGSATYIKSTKGWSEFYTTLKN